MKLKTLIMLNCLPTFPMSLKVLVSVGALAEVEGQMMEVEVEVLLNTVGNLMTRHFTSVVESNVKVAAVVGFPLGAMDGDSKRYETEVAIDLGAQEIDMVLNIGRLKDGDDRAVFREIRDVVEAAQGVWVKVILETCLLSEEEKLRACSLSVEAGARFVKTSTGFGSGGATVEDVRLMRQAVGSAFGVKASGGIRDTATALAMLEAGANRLGTSSGVAIVNGHAAALGGY
jgi:deoxyribose-phosphate aldolase